MRFWSDWLPFPGVPTYDYWYLTFPRYNQCDNEV